MGNTKKALELIMTQFSDVTRAIDFCKEHDDPDLWEDLILFSLNKPSYVTALLCSVGTHVNPLQIVERIPKQLEIPGLRDALVRIIQDYNLQVKYNLLHPFFLLSPTPQQ